jgi:dUTP pyrophosphatase
MKIEIKKLHPNAVTPTKGTDGSSGYDLYALEGADLTPGVPVAIPTGISAAIPKGYGGFLCPRSGLSSKGININGPGIIDSDYRGDIKAILINNGNSSYHVNEKDRVAQILFVKTEDVEFDEAKDLSDTSRKGGLGSTGK